MCGVIEVDPLTSIEVAEPVGVIDGEVPWRVLGVKYVLRV